MLTIKAEIKRSEQKVDGTFNVKLRFTKNRCVKRMSTSLYVRESDLTSTGTFKKSSPIKQEIDNLVYEYQLMCAKLQVDINDYSLDQLFVLLKHESEKSEVIDFIAYSKDWIEASSLKGKGNYTSAINSFAKFYGKSSIDINTITVNLLNKYITFLNHEREVKIKQLLKENKRVPSNRKLSLYLLSLQHLYREAMKHYNNGELGIVRIKTDPFAHISIPKQEATRKRALTAELVGKISQLKDKSVCKGIHHTNRYNLAKDMFVLSFCLIGMNSVDIYNAKEIVDGRIIYNRTKTTDRRIDEARMEVEVPQMVLPIIEKYRDKSGRRLFNFHRDYCDYKAFNKAINKGLKQIGAELGIDDLEFYAARHSWATLALNKCKIDKYTVHAALNHVDNSMKVTDIYIERDFVNENEANKKVLKYVFG